MNDKRLQGLKSFSLSTKISIIDEQIASLKEQKDELVILRRQESLIKLLGKLPYKGMKVKYRPHNYCYCDKDERNVWVECKVSGYDPLVVSGIYLDSGIFPSHLSPSSAKQHSLSLA